MKPNVMMKTTSPEANDETSWREGVGEDVEDFEVGEDDEQVPPPPSSSSSLSRLFHPFASWWCKLLKTFVNKHSNHTHNLLNIKASTATKDEEDVTEENSFEYKHTTHSCRSLFTIMGICLVLLLLLSLLKLAVPSLGEYCAITTNNTLAHQQHFCCCCCCYTQGPRTTITCNNAQCQVIRNFDWQRCSPNHSPKPIHSTLSSHPVPSCWAMNAPIVFETNIWNTSRDVLHAGHQSVPIAFKVLIVTI